MPKKNYENMWHELKSNVERNIISVYPEVREHVPDYRAGQYNILEELGAQIDELEGTFDIQNIIDDMNRTRNDYIVETERLIIEERKNGMSEQKLAEKHGKSLGEIEGIIRVHVLNGNRLNARNRSE